MTESDKAVIQQALDVGQMAFNKWRNNFVNVHGHMPTGADAWKASAAIAQPVPPAIHESDCSMHNEPACPAGPCDCRLATEEVRRSVLRKHIDHIALLEYQLKYQKERFDYMEMMYKTLPVIGVFAKLEDHEEVLAQPVEPANDKLLQIIAAAYQIAGACDLPVHILDVLANPGLATQEQIDAMLPFVQTEQVAASAKGPSTLWLQLHGDCTDDETRQPVDYENDGVTWCWHAIHDSDVRYVRADLVQSEQPAQEHNFCSRCSKRLGGIDDIHTCTAPAHLNLSKQTVEKLHKFLDAAAGDGVISDGVDAADLYIEIFPEQYAESIK